jgi:hypothetical protein
MKNECQIKTSEAATFQQTIDHYVAQCEALRQELHETKSNVVANTADVTYLEKENLELHLELKQTKRLLAEAQRSSTSSMHVNINHRETPQSQKTPTTIARKVVSTCSTEDESERENAPPPPPETVESAPECPQQ